MNLINNRYRIIKTLTLERQYSEYLCEDMWDKNNIVQINIINSSRISKELVDYFKKESINLSTLSCDGIMGNKSFGSVTQTDSNLLLENHFFYSREYIQDPINVFDYINDFSFNEIMDLFLKLCKTTHYLHLRGYYYRYLNFENIYFINDKGFIRPKLKDLFTLILENDLLENDKELYRPSNIKPKDRTYDIYSLTSLLISFLSGKEVYLDSKSNLKQIQEVLIGERFSKYTEEEKNLICKIPYIIERFFNDENYSFNYLYEFIENLNEEMNKDYSIIAKSQLELLNHHIKLVDREKEIAQFLEEYNNMINFNPYKNIILVEGEIGTGKTRFLEELKYLMEFENINIYSSLSLKSSGDRSMWREILRKVILSNDKDLVKKYSAEINQLLPSSSDINSDDLDFNFTTLNDNARLANRIANLIGDSSENKPSILIIDDINQGNNLTMDILKYLCQEVMVNKNIILVLGYNSLAVRENIGFSNFISNLKETTSPLSIELNNLTLYGTGTMMRYILGMAHIPEKLASKIYGKSHGNPFFIMEAMNDLYQKKLIYIQEATGLWYVVLPEGDTEYTSLNIPNSIEQMLLNRLEGLKENTKQSLNIISIFSSPVQFKDLEEVSGLYNQDLKGALNELLNKEILNHHYVDDLIFYDIPNKILKDIIYDRLPDELKTKYHKKIGCFLEDKFIGDETIDLEELLYHLYKLDYKEKLIQYSIINAKNKLNIKDIKTAILHLEKALLYMKYNSDDELCEITTEIGLKYFDIEDIENAEKYYSKAETYNITDIDKKAKIYLAKASLAIFNFNFDKAYEFLNKTGKIIQDSVSLENKLKYKWLLGYRNMLNEDYEAAIKIFNELIEETGDDYPRIKAKSYRGLGDIYSLKSNTDEAIVLVKKSIDIFKKIGDLKEMIYALNKLGAIYDTNYQDHNKAMEYFFEVYDLSRKYNLLSGELLSLSNIGVSMYEKYEYKQAEKYLRKSLDKAIEANYVMDLAFLYISFVPLYLDMADYKQANEFYDLALKNPYKSLDEFDHILALKINWEIHFGNYQKAYQIIPDLMKTIANENSKVVGIYLLKKYFLEVKINDSPEDIGDFNKILDIASNIDKDHIKIMELSPIVLALYSKGLFEKSNKLFNIMKDSFHDDLMEEVKAKYYYTEAVIRSEDVKVLAIKNAEKIAKNRLNKLLLIQIQIEKGHYFFNRNNYLSLNYYIDASYRINSLLSTIADEYKISFINKFDFQNLFININKLKSTILKDSNGQKLDFLESEPLENLLFLLEDYKFILEDSNFQNKIREVYSQYHGNSILDEKSLISSLKTDTSLNLDLILGYFANLTLATDGAIIIEEEGELLPISFLREARPIVEYKPILDKAKSTMEPILLSNNTGFKTNLPLAYICLPIFSDKHSRKVTAYISLESDSIVNYFNKENLDTIKNHLNLISILLEKNRLKKYSTVDKLTGALTRRALEDKINQLILEANKTNASLSIIMFDLDKFKNVNDRFGHLVGDNVLKEVAKIGLNSLREDSFLGRYGGEEFIVILPNRIKEEAFFIGEDLRLKIYNKKILGDKANISVSMGISTYPMDGVSFRELIDKADQALYYAKENGRNRTIAWERGLDLKIKPKSKIDGIVIENEIKNSRNILAIVELIQLMNEDLDYKDKIYSFLGRVIDTLEVQTGYILIVDNNEVTDTYGRSLNNEQWLKNIHYNQAIVKDVIENKQGTFLIDWKDVSAGDIVIGLPIWNSVLVFPIIRKGQIKALIYLVSPIKSKEFDENDYNLVDVFGNIFNIW